MCRRKIAVNVFFSSPHRRPFYPFPLVHRRSKLWIRIPSSPNSPRLVSELGFLFKLPWKLATSIAGIQPYQ
ncbi:unnamed protein product [Musa textilis]